jgi:CheY-like chemotaxis protein
MGGAIVLESARGIGSTFRFSIPVRPADVAPIVTPAVPMTVSMRILLVEDHPVNQRVAVALLQKLGHTADVVADGASAITAVTAKAYDVVFLDLRLPDGSGLDLVHHLRASRAGLRVVAMTANAMPEDRAACAAAGMDDFLAKPFSSQDLAAVLARALEARAVELVRRAAPGAVVN